MKITGISWLGVGTDRFDETVDFFSNALGLSVAVSDPRGVAMLGAGDAVVEIFGPGTGGHALTCPPVAAFETGDVVGARDELMAKGVEMIGEIGRWNGFEWFYFKGPDDQTYAIKRTPSDWEGNI